MELKEICLETLSIIEKLECGEISFSYDKLSSAMKPGHPAELLDDVLAEIFFDVMDGQLPDLKKIDHVRKGLKRLQRSFKIKELGKPIKDLSEYLDSHSAK